MSNASCAALGAPQDADDTFGLQTTVIILSLWSTKNPEPFSIETGSSTLPHSLHVHPGLDHPRGRIHYLFLFNANTYVFFAYLMNLYMTYCNWSVNTPRWSLLKNWRKKWIFFFLINKTATKKWIEKRTWNSLQVNLEFSNIEVFQEVFLRKAFVSCILKSIKCNSSKLSLKHIIILTINIIIYNSTNKNNNTEEVESIFILRWHV